MAIGPGDVVGTYEIVRRIGAGGTAEVFEVRHTVLGTSHALKVLLPQWVENAHVRSRFLQEGRIQSKLEHPGIVRVTDTVAEPHVAGLVMELLRGEALRDRLDREGRPAPKEAVTWVRAVLDALVTAHAEGVTHRDLKPENVFLEQKNGSERVRLLDFGIAKAPEASHQTSHRGALGTCAYMSPEQVKDPSSVDARTDVFAMGCVLWELLVGRPPFEGSTPYDSMQKVLTHEPGPPSAHRNEVPSWLDDVVMAALAKKREDRLQTARAFADALDAGARGTDLPRQALPERARPSGSGMGWALVGLVIVGLPVLALALVIVGGIVMGVALRPARIDRFTASSDPCGLTTLTVQAEARSRTLELFADGRSLGTWPVSGPTHVVHVEPLDLEAQVTLEARVGDASDTLVHPVGGQRPAVLVARGTLAPNVESPELTGSAREGAVGRTLLRVYGTCLPPGTTWEATVDGRTTSGPVPPSQEVWLETGDLPQGTHLLEGRLVDPGDGSTLARSSYTLTVEGPPPPGDADMDGFVGRAAGGPDCDDGDPDVNPAAAEHTAPNGRDDDCDGLVDEGTIAYDDDGDGLSEQQGDCDDADRATFPGAPEQPDCRDQDCDGEVDEGVALGSADDAYEPNDTQQSAWDLRTSTQRSFSQDLELVAMDTVDVAWFRFYSQDGDWDDWGIDVTATRMPANSALRLDVLDSHGTTRGTAIARRDGDQVLVRGKAFRDDSGDYLLQVTPMQLHANGCPVRLSITSR